MRSVGELLDLWPSQAELARDLGLPYQTAAAWKARGAIPPAYWRDLVVAAQRRGLKAVSAQVLAVLHARETKTRSGREARGEIGDPQNDPSPRVETESAEPSAGHFSRFFHLRRSHFASIQEINDHLTALREEWER